MSKVFAIQIKLTIRSRRGGKKFLGERNRVSFPTESFIATKLVGISKEEIYKINFLPECRGAHVPRSDERLRKTFPTVISPAEKECLFYPSTKALSRFARLITKASCLLTSHLESKYTRSRPFTARDKTKLNYRHR